MNQNNSIFWPMVVALVAIVIAICACFLPLRQTVAPSSGSVTNGTAYPHGIQVGNPSTLGVYPTNLATILSSTCALIASTYTVAATSSVNMDCSVPGSILGDLAFAQFASSTTPGSGWSISGAAASSTSGFVTFTVYNGTGASAVIPASIASSTKYLVIQTQ